MKTCGEKCRKSGKQSKYLKNLRIFEFNLLGK